MSIIITPVTNISRGDTVFDHILNKTNLGKRAHVLRHLNGRMILGSFERFFYEGYLWRGHRAIISFITKTLFCEYLLSWVSVS